MDEGLIDYDMDSEEEWAEENGEDVDAENEDEEMPSDDESEEDQFIVSDGHLSVCDISLDGSESMKVAEIERRRQDRAEQTMTGNIEVTYIVTTTDSSTTEKEFLYKFHAISLCQRPFPLSLNKPAKETKQNDPVIGLRAELVRLTYETLDSK